MKYQFLKILKFMKDIKDDKYLRYKELFKYIRLSIKYKIKKKKYI
jgi:hypothetical protein